MKVLITAPPKTGKSTLIREVVALLKEKGKNCHGVLSAEKLDCTGERVGFTALLSDGSEELFMIKEKSCDTHMSPIVQSDADVRVGPYRVQLNVINDIVVPMLQKNHAEGTSDSLLYIDEIGRAQAFSSEFLKTVTDIFLHSRQSVLASIVFADEVWSRPFKTYDCACLVEVTIENRNFLPQILVAMFSHSYMFEMLPKNKQYFAKSILLELLHLKMYYSAKKLFSNAIKYVLEEKILLNSTGSQDSGGCVRCFEVIGDTSRHDVKEWSCARNAEELSKGSTTTTPVTTAATALFSDPSGTSDKPSATSSPLLAHIGSGSSNTCSGVLRHMDLYSCDCPLFNGIAPFDGNPQVCSHILAILIKFNDGDSTDVNF